MSETTDTFDEWAIVELMGHRKLAGKVSEVEQFGTKMLRVDIPGDEGETYATQFYGGAAVYCLTPTTERVARSVAAANRPAPVARWELPQPADDDEVEAEAFPPGEGL